MARPMNRENLMSLADQIIWAIENSQGSRIATGTYTGDGAATQAITGAGFQPRVVFIIRAASTVAFAYYMKSDTMALNSGYPRYGTDFLFGANHIISLDADGFTVGNADFVNNSLDIYHWMAWG